MTEELKPCPLCGDKPYLDCYEDSIAWNGEYTIDCASCGLSLKTSFIRDIAKPKKADSKAFNRELAVTRWNRRVK